MNDWIAENSMVLIIALAAAGAALLLATLVLLALWLRARRTRRREAAKRIRLDRERIDLELSLAEQQGRLRIIRELHEVSVHDMSVIIGQADGARYAAESDPTAAVRAVATIADVARNTLADLRRVMTVVREGEVDVDVHPQLKSSRHLFKVMTEAGLRLTIEESGDRYDLKPGAELAIYRILQEALTNALTHGGEGTNVTVVQTWTGEGFQLRVDDDGIRNELRRSGLNPNDASQHRPGEIDDDLTALTGVIGGAGITEMRERTELFGGVFTSTLNAGVGFSIAASFPSLRYHNGVHGVNLDPS
ncbi:signal transduction histidine kinase [Conyzicola lurida]|uniref:histidine kinase n=1 Tax=Conyzicola lurida TaxID=1172621 RepID=A0A841APM7_9MICO|nr:signal transduction histidine kinase [Conyzicola lurida]